jgi:hypothetical protein
MSNRPDVDPIGHAAKFVALLALLPVIFGSIVFFLPRDIDHTTGWQKAVPFLIAAFMVLIGLGVYRRSIAAAWAGIALFAAGLLGLAYAALSGEHKRPAVIFFALMLIWPIKKLFDAITAIKQEQGKQESKPPA